MIYYAGVPTLLPSPEVERYINALIGDVFLEPGNGPLAGGTAPTIPQMNWRTRCIPKVNTLDWPTGASRWSTMYLLVDSVSLATIVDLTSPSEDIEGTDYFLGTGAQLQICDTRNADLPSTIPINAWTKETDGERIALSTEMFALQPRPLSLPYTPTVDPETGLATWAETTEKTVWLLPIVDERWFWQWKNVSNPSSFTSWSDAINHASLATMTQSTVNAEFGDPPDAETFHWANAAASADWLAHSIGQRIVRDINKTLYCISPSDGTTRWNTNLTGTGGLGSFPEAMPWQRMSGGVLSALHHAGATVPEKIRIVFTESGTTEVVNTRDHGATEYRPGTEVVIYSGAAPTSETNYADTMAANWIAWRGTKADIAFSGVKAWKFSGFEDRLILSHGSIGDGEWGASTRIATIPENFGPEQTGGGSDKCPNRYVFEHLGNPTGGTSTLELYGTYKGVDLAADMTAVIPWDATDSEIKTLLETANGYDPEADPVTGFAVTVVGGPLPNNDITITLPAGVRLRTITAEDALTPTSILRYSRVRSCCGG